MAETVTVPVKSWVESKINWTQVLGAAASFATIFGWTVPPELVPQTVGVITGIQSVVTIILRTWFNKSVTPESL